MPEESPSASRGRRFVLRGRVQGVGFRWWTVRAARDHGVSGWVRNLPDGSVEILASADDATLDRFATAIRVGPPGAQVEFLAEEAAVVPAGEFRIREI